MTTRITMHTTMHRTTHRTAFVPLALASALLAGVYALEARAVPTTLTYAGVLTDSDVRVEGTHDVIFELFDDDTGGTVQYSETVAGLIIVDGELVAEIGNNNLDDSVLALPELWLEVTVDGTPLSPRVRLNSVPYALRAIAAQEAIEAVLAEEALSLGGILPEDVVTTTALAAQLATLGLSNGVSAGTGITVSNGTVSIAPAGVGAAQLAAGAVTTGALADLAVTSGKIANGAVNTTQIANGAVGTTQLATGAVNTAQIAAGAVTTQQLGTGAVGGLQLATNAVSTGNIADGAVTSVKIASGAVGTAQIADLSITTPKLAANIIQNGHLQNSSVDSAKISNLSITASDLAPDSVTSGAIAPDAVRAIQIQASAVTTAEIANGTITSSDISGGTNPVFFTPSGCAQAGLTFANSCRTVMCNVISGIPQFFNCTGTCNQGSSLNCATTSAGFMFTTSLAP